VFVDCRKMLPLADNTVDSIMLEEVIEHLDYPEGLQLLRECNRILRDRGTLRISTPDLSWFARLATTASHTDAEDPNWVVFLNTEGCRLLGGGAAPAGLIRIAALNSIFLLHGHRFVYTAESLEELLRCAGFHYRRSSYQDGGSSLGRMDTHAERFRHPPEISLYYGAWKGQ
jgi:SAM-dependent methyltransferase